MKMLAATSWQPLAASDPNQRHPRLHESAPRMLRMDVANRPALYGYSPAGRVAHKDDLHVIETRRAA